MALLIETETDHGVTMTLYWRFNNFDQYPNRDSKGEWSVPAIARFRGFASEEAWKADRAFVQEQTITYTHDPASGDPRAEAYAAFKAQDYVEGPIAARNQAQTLLSQLQAAAPAVEAAEAELATAKEQPDSLELQGSIRRLEQRLTELRAAADAASGEVSAQEKALAEAEAVVVAAQKRQASLTAAVEA